MKSTNTKLHLIHEPITDLFPRLGDRTTFELSDEQVAFFHENGYVKGGRVLDSRQIEALRAALERIRTGENPRLGELYEIDEDYRRAPDQNVFHFLGAWLIEAAFHDILWHPAITVKASQLLGTPRVRLWHDQVFYKPARHPGVVTWHQDYSYWTRAAPPRHVTCWIGLDDSTLENGCVHYVPKSHRWNLLPKVSLTQDMDAIKSVMTPEQLAEFRPAPMILKAGECTFHHSHMLHGSWGNASDRPRRAVVLNFMHPETRCADGQNPLLFGVPIIPEGEIIQGDYFPIVLE
jgi:ectoine hydroxylase-related dioxygenase (phytanoyl-CoA dioxygenase family)